MNKEIRTSLKNVFSNLNYQKLILFGSRARGDFSEGSDYDILIIVQKSLTIKEKMELSTHFKKELATKRIDADIIVKSSEEIDYYKDKIGSVVRSALKEGVAL